VISRPTVKVDSFRIADDLLGTTGRHVRADRVRPCKRAACLGLCQA
jgi:hypothetical protein